MTQANVLPSDRVAAADLLDEISSLLDHNGIGQVADLIRDGEYDEHEATIAFARHRDASVRELVEALEKCRDQFAFYASEHLGAGKMDKAATNKRFADLADAALASAGAQP